MNGLRRHLNGGENELVRNILIEEQAYSTAIEASIKASNIILTYWPNPNNDVFNDRAVNEIYDKKDGIGNYATLADMESEKIITKTIMSQTLLREQSIVGEETGSSIKDSSWRWIIDPIDGTPPFKNGLPEYGVSIGLIKDNEPIIGVIAMPALRQLISVRRNHGVYLMSFQGEVIADLRERNLAPDITMDSILVGYDLGYQRRSEQVRNVVAKVVDVIGYAVSYGSTSAAIFRLAQSLLGGYFSCNSTIFDIAAASAIIREIGGVVTDLKGQPINWSASNQTILTARTHYIHERLLKIIND